MRDDRQLSVQALPDVMSSCYMYLSCETIGYIDTDMAVV